MLPVTWKHLIIPGVVGVQKRIATLFVGELRIDTKASADRMCSSDSSWKTDVHRLRKLFALCGPNMNVAM